MLLDKKKALFVKCCIIANGVTDSQGDTLYAEDIKKIFTSFNNQDNFEVRHNDIPIEEVSLLENYITTADETIGTAVVPRGSWNAVIRVDNPEIKEALLTGEFRGVSLNNRIADKCKANLKGQVRYKDLSDTECVIPLLISFVEAGANGYGLHVMDYDAYIKKSSSIKKGAKNMAFDLLGGLKSLVKQAEASESESEARIIKEKDQEEEEPVDKEETTEEEEEVEVKKEDETTSEEETIKEDDTTDDDFEAKVTAIVKKVLAEIEAEKENGEEESSEEEVADEDTPKITKSKVINTDDDFKTQSNKTYFEMTGRDPLTGLPKQ